MSVTLRLSRGGTKKRPFYRIVAADKRSPRDGRFIERLGTYDPMKPKDSSNRLYLNIERVKYWLSVGALPTERVAKFLSTQKLYKTPEIREQTKKNKPRKKTLEKLKAKEEKIASSSTNATQEKSLESPAAEKSTEAPAAEKSTEAPAAEKSTEAPVAEKYVEDRPKEKKIQTSSEKNLTEESNKNNDDTKG